MREFLVTSIMACLVSSLVPAQQVGNAQRNYTINGVGSNQPSYVSTNVGANASSAHAYSTTAPNVPCSLVLATQGIIGWYIDAQNSVDVGPGGFTFIINGFDPGNPFAGVFRTSGTGALNFTVPTPPGLGGLSVYLAMAHADPAAPASQFFVSQTHLVNFVNDPNLSAGSPTCTPGGTPLVLTDDSFVQVSLGFNFTFYNVAYSQAFVGSNGFITFNAGNTTFTETVALFLSGSPRIAFLWDDLNPATGGTISFYTDNSATAEVCFTNVPEFAFAANLNTVRTTLSVLGFITMDYGGVATPDALVGLSPGTNLAPGLAVNLSAGPNTFMGLQAPHELFLSAFDLANLQVTWTLDATGTPTGQF